jgi:hypothetical protein
MIRSYDKSNQAAKSCLVGKLKNIKITGRVPENGPSVIVVA